MASDSVWFPKKTKGLLILRLPYMAVCQNEWYHFGVGAPPIVVFFSGDWDVHWGNNLDFDPWPY